VVGGGPAGLTAAHYLRRFRRDVTVFDEGGGRASRIPRTHNYPGFPGGIAGRELLARMRQQLDGCGGGVIARRVTSLAVNGRDIVVETAQERVVTRAVLLATGVCDVEPRIAGIEEVRDHGLLRECPVCDAFEFADRRIAVAGAGKHGVREALFLRDYSARVTFLALHGEPDLAPESLAKLRGHGIDSLVGTATHVAVSPDGAVVVTMDDGTRRAFDVLYSALGSMPNAKLATDVGAAIDAAGNVVVDAHGRTSVRGVYAAGDVVVGLDQLSVAVGQAAIAATAIHNDLRSNA
jgi:thioredoxin reductase (NADPH)